MKINYITVKQILHLEFHAVESTYTRKKSMTSADKGEAPETIQRTLPPSVAVILLNTNLSHIGDDFLPEIQMVNIRNNSTSYALSSNSVSSNASEDYQSIFLPESLFSGATSQHLHLSMSTFLPCFICHPVL